MENIIFTTDSSFVLSELLRGIGHDQLFVVADKHTVGFCDKLLEKVDWVPSHVIVLDCGEENKSIESVGRIWNTLSTWGARRSSVLLCVGGGMVTDVGGFAASTFKRGMRCMNVPTTLLSQVDASMGGKTGFNLNGFKNEIGTFFEPERVIIDTGFIRTLPLRERMSGFAEMVKHGLLSDTAHLDRLLACDSKLPGREEFLELIRKSVQVKDKIVTLDPLEKGVRKVLNFGHTVGHAIESFSMNGPCRLLHGEAVALGMVVELYLSVRQKGFPREVYERVRAFVTRYYPKFELVGHEDALYRFMLHDKKNDVQGVNFTLLEDVGVFSINNYCGREEIVEALRHL